MDQHGRDPYPGEDDPTPKPCPECGHIDWEMVGTSYLHGPQPQPIWMCGNCSYQAFTSEEVYDA